MPALYDLPAPAKLNLFLHIVGRRPDGYHLLESVFALIDWHDTLHIETRSDQRIVRHDLGQALPEDDLCLRAARLLREAAQHRGGCDIHIDKRLPSGAGMGGGSSDAATVLLALNRLWGLDWPLTQLADLALQLGADVPFFIHGRTAWVAGVGEQITLLPDHPALSDVLGVPVAVVKPPIVVPTAAIFGAPGLKRDTPHAIVEDFLAAPRSFGRNDLQGPAQAYVPADNPNQTGQITQALAIMQNQYGNSRMTGSGSAVFSWIDPDTLASETRSCSMPLALPDARWQGRVCRTLDRHPLHARLLLT